MAYLDDKNNNLYTAGDPLEALDRELAELKNTLGELEGKKLDPAAEEGSQSEANEPKTEKSNPDPESDEQKRITEDAGELTDPVEEDRADGKAPLPEKKSRASLAAVLILMAILLLGGVGFGVFRSLAPSEPDSTSEPTASGKMITVTDSEMGEIDLQTVKGTKLNTLDKANLQIDENGSYAYYEDGVKISHLGVDLSEFQTGVDFEKLKNAGVEFVMLRVGGRYYGERGAMYEDSSFEGFYEQASAAGLKIGAYFLSQATTAEEAREEADFIIKKLNGRGLDYPIAFDWENIADDEARTDNVTNDMLTLMAEAFCNAVSEAGYKPIVYSNTEQMLLRYDFETMKDYDFWLADYRDFPSMYYKFDMWQYSKSGTIDGVEGTVDLNLSFTDFEE